MPDGDQCLQRLVRQGYQQTGGKGPIDISSRGNRHFQRGIHGAAQQKILRDVAQAPGIGGDPPGRPAALRHQPQKQVPKPSRQGHRALG